MPFKASASSRPLLLVCSAPGINVIGTLIVSRERSPQFNALGLPGSASRCSVTLTSMPWWNDRDGEAHETIPIFARTGFKYNAALLVAVVDAVNSYFEDHAGPARIGNDKIAAAAEHKQWKASGMRNSDGFGNLRD